ncbi:unnamed protein product [Pelagomonas calceolata]|uniref:MYND-type domain-containing protein n=1 Tax=Pelagomonas calceolata TaxID=35677 RepID=A0A8J2X4F7_9STRA|nr:unnamed protein product [Pelagomonas calceolata]
MILTNCAACAAPLAHNAPRCVRCKLRYLVRRPGRRYCNATCQHDHWRRGHKQMCKKIHRGGNAEQYNADKKYKEAVAVAVEACADDTKGQTCFICTQALHWKTKEGLVRGCACRGTAGFAHVSCLAEQAKILCDEAEENNLSNKTFTDRFGRWYACSLCEQEYHGVVRCALGWACWKTYVGRLEADWARGAAMTELGLGLLAADHYEDALSVQEADLATLRRLGAPEHTILVTQNNIANTYHELGRLNEALSLQRDVYSGWLKLYGEEHERALRAAYNYALSFLRLKRFEEVKALLRRKLPVARRVLGSEHEVTLSIREDLCRATLDGESSAEEKREALRMLEEIAGVMRRVMGPAHPNTLNAHSILKFYRRKFPWPTA